jgi:nitroreductase
MTEMGQNLFSYERVYLKGNKASKYKFLKNHKYFILNGLILSIFTTIYIKIINNYKKKLLEKDKEIEKLKENIFQNQIQVISTEQKDNKIDDYKKYSYNLQDFNFEENFSYDKKFYKLNNMRSTEDINRLDYELLMAEHSLEKGLSHFNLRPFGKMPLKRILKFINLELKYEHSENHFAFSTAINLLKQYKKIYEEKKWTSENTYKNISKFLIKYEKMPEQKTGSYVLTKEELKNDYSIDYKKFIKSRHSLRNYKNERLKIEDIKEAIEMAKYSPSACNRQYIKVHYYPIGKMKENVINFSVGKGGIDLEGVNTFIITYDANGLQGAGERNQGYFNAGLFSTNLANSFHSLGIGTCFIQFSNSVEDEEKLKRFNDIPFNERIAVILYAGYYDEKSIFCVSPRKPFEDIFTEHK